MAERRAVVFLSSADPGALRLAGSAALAAAALGDRVDVYLFGPAVRAVVESHEHDRDEPGGLLHAARAAGDCRLVACSASLVEDRVSLDAAEQALDAVVGWPTIIEWSRGVVDRYFF